MRIIQAGLRCVACCMMCVVVLAGTPVSAQPATVPALPHDGSDRPWARGVSDAEQEVARALHVEGNAEFMESRFSAAIAKYRAAIAHWDHPAIRFNMAVCLINLDQLVEARDDLERSLAYGAVPLGADAHAQGMTYRKLLDAQLAYVTATASEPGAVVTLDGKYLFTAPGRARHKLLPGEHQLAVTKPGFRTAFRTFVAIAGKQAIYELQPRPELDPPYWRYWKHVLGAGGVLAGAGALTYLWARRDLASYDDTIAQECPNGCTVEMLRALVEVNARKDGAMTKQAVAITLLAAGGAAVLTGVLGLIIDKPRVRREPSRAAPVVTAVPGGATVALGWTF